MTYTENWWKEWNSRIIWGSIGILFIIVLISSYDFDKPFPNFALLGQNQFIMGGFITLLLLFRYITKIKIAGILEVDLNTLASQIENVSNRLSQIRGLERSPEIEEAKRELDKAKETLNQIKLRADYY